MKRGTGNKRELKLGIVIWWLVGWIERERASERGKGAEDDI